MPNLDYKNQIEKYEYISGQHGGYYRHGFIDHAYLYNLYFLYPVQYLSHLVDTLYHLFQINLRTELTLTKIMLMVTYFYQ